MHTEAELATALAKHLIEHRRLIGATLASLSVSTSTVSAEDARSDGGSGGAPSGARRSGGTP